MSAFLSFLAYFGTGLAILLVYMYIYEKLTPYREFDEIKNGNMAAALAFGGSMIGFVMPLLSSVFFTHSLLEMVKWGLITGVVQLLTFEIAHRLKGFGDCVKNRNTAAGMFLALLSLAVGLLNAVSISY